MPKYLFLPKLKGKGMAFLEWTSVGVSSKLKLSLTCGGNVNCHKNVHNPIPTLPVEIENALATFKTNQ